MKFRVVQFFVQCQPKRLNLATILKGWFSPLELNLEYAVLTLLLFDVIKNSFKHTTIFFRKRHTNKINARKQSV